MKRFWSFFTSNSLFKPINLFSVCWCLKDSNKDKRVDCFLISMFHHKIIHKKLTPILHCSIISNVCKIINQTLKDWSRKGRDLEEDCFSVVTLSATNRFSTRKGWISSYILQDLSLLPNSMVYLISIYAIVISNLLHETKPKHNIYFCMSVCLGGEKWEAEKGKLNRFSSYLGKAKLVCPD